MKISILGFTYNVVRGYVSNRCEGQADHLKQIIRIDSSLDFDNTIETLLHEVMHCIEYAMDMDMDEKHIARLSRGLYSVLEDPQNEAFWAALAGSDEIMEEEEGYVAVDLGEGIEELEGYCPGCASSRNMCVCGHSEIPTQSGEGVSGVAYGEGQCVSDAKQFPRWTDPEAERSRLSFADACRRKAEETGRVVVTTTQDYLQGPVYGDPNYHIW